MRLLIIVTYPVTELWKKAGGRGWQRFDDLTETKVRVSSVGSDEVAVFCQAATSSKPGETQREEENRLTTTQWILQTANSPRYAEATLFVAAHHGYVDAERVRAGVAAARFGGATDFHHEPGTPGAHEIYDDLLELVSEPGPDTLGTALGAVKKKS